MAKKSRRAAARYSELSKAGKKKARGKYSPQPVAAVSAPEVREAAAPKPARRPAAKAAPRKPTDLKRGLPAYDYVRSDLKRIGMLAGGMILILIILTFALG